MSYSIDSRTVCPGDVFIPICGESMDGNEFIVSALTKGSRKVIRRDISVLAKDHRDRFGGLVIGITGSSGKTSTKDLLYHVLSTQFSVYKTAENFNNEIGVPLTVMNIPFSSGIAIVEMAMRAAGQIRALTQLVRPDIAIITNIGFAHLEFFKNRQAIAQAKTEVFDFPKEAGKQYITFFNSSAYGFDNVKIQAEANGFDFIEYACSDILEANIVLVTQIALYLGMFPARIQKAIESFRPVSKLREAITETDGYTLINDTYNANPDSMRYAIAKAVAIHPDRPHVLVLGDMLELGCQSSLLHQELGQWIDLLGVSAVYTLGPLSRSIECSKTPCYHYLSQDTLLSGMNDTIKLGSVILVKGSRGMKMERMVEGLIHA